MKKNILLILIAAVAASYGCANKARLGVEVRPLIESEAKENNTGDSCAVAVMRLIAGGNAEKAGIKTGDIITEIDGKTLDLKGPGKASDFARQIMELPATSAVLTVIRSKKPMKITVQLGAA